MNSGIFDSTFLHIDRTVGQASVPSLRHNLFGFLMLCFLFNRYMS